MWRIWLKKHVLWQNSDTFVTEVGLSVSVGCTTLGIPHDICTGQMLCEGTQCHPALNALCGVTPGDGVGSRTGPRHSTCSGVVIWGNSLTGNGKQMGWFYMSHNARL